MSIREHNYDKYIRSPEYSHPNNVESHIIRWTTLNVFSCSTTATAFSGHSWARKWGMRFQPVKCNMMQLTRKRIKKIHASYTLEGTNLENVESIKYLGVTITSDLRWNTHVSNVCTKANRTLGFLRRNLYSCPQEVKEAAYKGLVRPVLDYGSSVWDPQV